MISWNVKEGKNIKRIFSNIILVAAVLVFLFAGYKLYGIFSEYNKAENAYEDIQESVVKEPEQSQNNEKDNEGGKKGTPMLQVDFSKLIKMNGDVVAWICFEEPSVINYPIVKSKDNQEYLTQTFEKKKNGSGALFVDMNNAGDFSDKNIKRDLYTFYHNTVICILLYKQNP